MEPPQSEMKNALKMITDGIEISSVVVWKNALTAVPMRQQLGDELLGVMRQIKRMFDPKNIFNPGKIFEVGSAVEAGLAEQRSVPTRIDNHLRENFTRTLELPFQPLLTFAFKDRSFIGNLEQCNGCGGCLKKTGIM